MKKAISILMIGIIIVFAVFSITACGGGTNTIAKGTYEKSGDGVGIGFTEFTVSGSTLTVSISGLMNVDYTYKIQDKQIKLTAQGSTLSYDFEKKDSSHYIINGAEYVKK